MKILETGQPTVAQPVGNKTDVSLLSIAREKKKAAHPEKGDTVELAPSPLNDELKSREAAQAKRIQALKALIESGKYEIDSRQVAEKMLARSTGK